MDPIVTSLRSVARISALLVCIPVIASANDPAISQLQADFRKLEFGMFIHYNMATYHGVQWVEGYPSPSTFDPGGEIDTDAWADAAKSAGMTYGVLTAKHVAGFCLWDSAQTTYDVMHPDCPVKDDLVAKFIKSFTSRGLKAGLYYCWRSPGFADKFKVLPPECDPAEHPLEEQIEFQKKQIAELVGKFPDVFYIWNDGLDDTIMPADEARTFFRTLGRPVLASSNWWDWGRKGTPFVDIAVKVSLRSFVTFSIIVEFILYSRVLEARKSLVRNGRPELSLDFRCIYLIQPVLLRVCLSKNLH